MATLKLGKRGPRHAPPLDARLLLSFLALFLAGCGTLEDRPTPIPRSTSIESSPSGNGSPITWSDGLSLPELLRAVERHGSARAALEEWEGARARKVTASTYPLNPEVMVDGAQSVTGAKSMVGIQVRQVFELGGRVGKREAVAEAGINRAASDARDVLRQLRGRVRRSYWACAVAERRLEVARRGSELANRDIDVAVARYEGRQATAIDVNLTKVAAGKARAAVKRAEGERAATRAEVEALTWELPPGGWKLADGVPTSRPEPDLGRALAAARAGRPDLASLTSMGDEADARAALAFAEAAPDLGVALGYQYERDRIMGEGVDIRMQEHSVTFGLSLSLPLWNRRRGEILEAEADRRRADAMLAALQSEVGREISSAVARLHAASETLDLFEKEILPAASKNLEDVRAAYAAGSVGITELLRAQEDYLQVLDESVEAEGGYVGARADLEEATDRSLEELTK